MNDSLWSPSTVVLSFFHHSCDLALRPLVNKHKLEVSSNNTEYKLIKLNKESSKPSWDWNGYLYNETIYPFLF